MRSAADQLCACCIFNAALTTLDEERSTIEGPTLLLEKHQFPGYELLGEIARGGMGVVFRARQFRPERVVALKVIASGELASPKMVERFRTEAETAARLEHPNIVPIFEVGSEGHWHFFSMRLIEGPTLAQVLTKGRMPPANAGALMVKIARAVQYAHSRGVLHRDIKPGNILVDSKGEPHLTDFGLAKVLEGDSDITHSEAVLGTPAYMAPEQASGNTRDATTAADVYALGAVLYEMLAGRPPFAADNTPALLRKIVEVEPKPPSAFGIHSAESRTGAASAEREVHRKSSFVNASDLDAICLKCLEKEPALRYRSAEQFADDLERALRGEPILARPSTATQRFSKWVRRDPTRAALVGTVVLAGFLLTLVSLAFNLRLTVARNKALTSEAETRSQLLSAHLRENARLNAAGNALLGMLPLLEAARIQNDDTATRQRLRERLSATVQFSPQLLRLWNGGGTPVQLRFSSDGQRLLAVLRSGEPRAWDLNTCQPIRHPGVSGRTYRASFIDPDGSRVLEYFNDEPYAHLWNVTTGTLTPVRLKSDGGTAGAFSPDGKIIATGGEQVRLWDTASGEEASVAITNSTRCLWLLFSPDSELITGHDGEQAWRWNVRTGERLNEGPLTIWPGLVPRFSTDGSQLLVGATGTVQVLNWPLGEVTSAVPVGTLFDMNLSPDGRQFVTACFRDQARVYDVETSHSYRLPMTHESGANKAMFSPDGALLATAGFDYQLRVVLASTHRPFLPAIQHSSLIEAVSFSADSRFLAVGDVEGIVQVWDLQSAGRPFLPHGRPLRRVANSQDGKRLVAEDPAGALHLCDLTTGAEIGQLSSLPSGRSQISLEPTGRFIAGAFGKNGVRVWDFSTRNVIHEIMGGDDPATRDVSGVVFKPDGSEFVTMTSNGLLQRWSTVDGKPVSGAMDRGENSFLLYWSGDGRWLAAAGNSSLTVWDAQTSSQLGAPVRCRSREEVTEVRFSPDSTRLVVSFGNYTTIEPAAAQIYELPSVRAVGAPLRHGDGVATTAFSSDGNLVATGGEDNVARIWRVADGKPVTGALRHNGIVRRVLFSPDDRFLATGSVDGAIRLWDVERGELIAPPVQFGGLARPICFTPDGQKLFLTASNMNETVWSITLAPKEMPLEQLQTLAECQTGLRAELSPGGMPLGAAELAAKFSTLGRSDSPLASNEDMPRWHSESAIVAERQGAWFMAAFHLQRLLVTSPNDAALRERLGRAREELMVRPRR